MRARLSSFICLEHSHFFCIFLQANNHCAVILSVWEVSKAVVMNMKDNYERLKEKRSEKGTKKKRSWEVDVKNVRAHTHTLQRQKAVVCSATDNSSFSSLSLFSPFLSFSHFLSSLSTALQNFGAVTKPWIISICTHCLCICVCCRQSFVFPSYWLLLLPLGDTTGLSWRDICKINQSINQSKILIVCS